MQNRKIKNAQKCELDGIKFDSRLEMHMYSLLKMHNIKFKLKYKFVIQEKFKYRNETVREISWTVDFLIIDHEIVLDTKGFANDAFPIKLKLFKKWIKQNCQREYEVILLKTKEDCEKFINSIR